MYDEFIYIYIHIPYTCVCISVDIGTNSRIQPMVCQPEPPAILASADLCRDIVTGLPGPQLAQLVVSLPFGFKIAKENR